MDLMEATSHGQGKIVTQDIQIRMLKGRTVPLMQRAIFSSLTCARSRLILFED